MIGTKPVGLNALKFKYAAGAATLTALITASLSHADQVILDDLIVDGSTCIGQDCVNGESFGFDTLRLKENNLRIKFQDTSSSASFPTVDWQITANESSNGGANKFSIDDIDSGRTPFTIEANAPSNALYVEDDGDIGVGTSTPAVNIHTREGNTPTLRLEQDGSSGFTSQTWDVAGNEANFFVRDVTNGSKLPFKIQPGAPNNTLYLTSGGDIGFGTASPSDALNIVRAGPANMRFKDTSTGGEWAIGLAGNDTIKISDISDSGVQFRFSKGAMLVMQPRGAAPSSPQAGGIYNDTSGALCWYNGAAWEKIIGAGTCD